MNPKVFTKEEIKKIVIPIARNRKIDRIFLFGSYARNEATLLIRDERDFSDGIRKKKKMILETDEVVILET